MDEAPTAVASHPGTPDNAPHPDASTAEVPSSPGALPTARRVEFIEFYEKNFASLVRLGTLLTGSPEVALDLVQDSFVRLHRRWPSVDAPLPYVRRSLVNAATSYPRRAALARRHLSTMRPEVGELEPDELFDALANLTQRQRAALVLRFYDDLDDRAIAAALRCRPATVRSLIHRGLGELRKVIDQ
jgi:RNA polymerase sigma factor (sigma-70 family)